MKLLLWLNHIGNPPVVKASDLKAAFDPLMKAEKDVQVINVNG